MRRVYFNAEGQETTFERALTNDRVWKCKHGGWSGTEDPNNPLVLHHDYGKATYERYEDYDL